MSWLLTALAALRKAPWAALWQGLRFALPFIFAGLLMWGVYRLGVTHDDAQDALTLAQIKAEQQQALLDAEQAYSAQLLDAQKLTRQWQERAGELNVQLIAAEKTIDTQKIGIERINHAVNQDTQSGTVCYSGLGTHSLQLYRQALGYTIAD